MGTSDPDFEIETTVDLDNIDEEAAQKLLKRAESDIEVVEKEDTRISPEDAKKKPLPENIEAEPTEEELKAYSDQVRQRIEKLTHARHDERRYKEQAERERDEAVAFAQRMYAERKALEEQAKKLAERSLTDTAAKIDADIAVTKRAYIDAVNAYDAEAMYEAQESLARLTARKEAMDQQKTVAPAVDKQLTTEVQQRQSTSPAPDTRARDWAARNSSWFQKDKAMTAFVFGVHEQLVEEGVDPRIDAETYYKRLDESVKKRFPERFESEAPTARTPRTSSPVAPATRVANGRRRVSLTATEMTLARRLGVTLEQFAAEKSSWRIRMSEGTTTQPAAAPRVARETQVRDNAVRGLQERSPEEFRKYQWKPADALPMPKAPLGWHYRYIRKSIGAFQDVNNFGRAMREGWETVPLSDHPELIHSIDQNAKNSGLIEIGALVLCKIPEEVKRARDEYYARMSARQIEAVDNNLMRESNPKMPLFNERKSEVSFGKGN